MDDLVIKDIYQSIDDEINDVKQLLASAGLELDPFVTKTFGMYDGDQLVATGSVSGNTIRSICIDKMYQGQSAINKLMTHLIDYLYSIGKDHIFIYTKPENSKSFEYLGFFPLMNTGKVLLIDSKKNGIYTYLEEIKEKQLKYNDKKVKVNSSANEMNSKDWVIGSIVMNGNPFTKGHKYLVEKALETCDELYVFVVWEQKSLFPNDVRFKLIKEGLKEYDQVHVVKGEDYIISSATFPTYFLKADDDLVLEHAKLDLMIFRDIITQYLGITRRYVGEEKLCATTRKYNEQMKVTFANSNISVIEIPRKKQDNKLISASYVRDYIKRDEWNNIENMVPTTTYDFLRSNEAKSILEKVRKSTTRH